MEWNFWFSAMAMAPAERPSRSSKSFSGKNTSAALDCAANPLADTPANCTESSTPGCCLAISPMRRTTSLVRSSDEAGWRAHESEHGERHQASVDGERDGRALHGSCDAALVGIPGLHEHAIEALEEAAEHLVHAARERIRCRT